MTTTEIQSESEIRWAIRAACGPDDKLPDLQTVKNERLIPRGAWQVLLAARTFDVRYVTFKRKSAAENEIKHLSYYSRYHNPHAGDDDPANEARTLCGEPLAFGRVFFDERSHARAFVCPRCAAIARERHLIVREDIRWEGGKP